MALSPGLQKYLPTNYQLLQIASFGCYPDIDSNVPSTENQCKQSNYFALKTISQVKPDVVVFARARVQSAKTLQDIADKLKEIGAKSVILVGPPPSWTAYLPKLLARHHLDMPRRMKTGLDEGTLAINSRLKREIISNSYQKYLDVIEPFCNDEGCLTYFGEDVKTGITTFDEAHFSPIASEYLAEKVLVKSILLMGGNSGETRMPEK